jgi:hypothetical protein
MIKDFRALNILTWSCLGFITFLGITTAFRLLARHYPILNLLLLAALGISLAVFAWILLSPQISAPLKLDAIETAAIVALSLVFAYGDALVRIRPNRHDAPIPHAPQPQTPRPSPSAPRREAPVV